MGQSPKYAQTTMLSQGGNGENESHTSYTTYPLTREPGSLRQWMRILRRSLQPNWRRRTPSEKPPAYSITHANSLLPYTENAHRHSSTESIAAYSDLSNPPPTYSLDIPNIGKLDPNWIDLGTLRLWLQSCDEDHGGRCAEPSSVEGFSSVLPQLLVDVKRHCLVPATHGVKYAALSYVWGGVSGIQTTKDTVERLRQEGAFADRDTALLIPLTVKHAMRLVHLLGIDYLWVDAFCIVQDDEEGKSIQIQNMGRIYRNAYVTLIAANGPDANHGLRGIPGVTDPRQLSTYFEYDLMESLQPYSSAWYSRAWTFQEMILSRRKIMFSYQVAVWECECCVWHEATGIHAFPEMEIDPECMNADQREIIPYHRGRTWSGFHFNSAAFPFKFPIWPDIPGYAGLVWDYNKRQLSFPEDALFAFSGVTSALSSTFHGGFISGLPQMFFDVCLLWQPTQPLKRRVPIKCSPSDAFLPSWSWVGWEGGIDTFGWRSGLDFRLDRELPERIFSTVQWHYCIGSERKPIIISYKFHQDCRFNEILPLPPGWFRNRTESDHYFVHELDEGAHFKFPIPIPDAQEQLAVIPPVRHICGRTSTAVFQRTQQINFPSQVTRGCPEIYLSDKEGSWAGCLQLNDSSGVQDDYELICLSAGSARNDMQSFIVGWENDLRPKDGELYEFYNVLWVEWEGRVAYRKALGHVKKDVWDRQAVEWIDIILG